MSNENENITGFSNIVNKITSYLKKSDSLPNSPNIKQNKNSSDLYPSSNLKLNMDLKINKIKPGHFEKIKDENIFKKKKVEDEEISNTQSFNENNKNKKKKIITTQFNIETDGEIDEKKLQKILKEVNSKQNSIESKENENKKKLNSNNSKNEDEKSKTTNNSKNFQRTYKPIIDVDDKQTQNFEIEKENYLESRQMNDEQLLNFDWNFNITEEKIKKFENILKINLKNENKIEKNENLSLEEEEKKTQNEKIDLEKLIKLSWSGIPYQFRSLVWKILIGYLPPTTNSFISENTKKTKLETYKQFIKQYYDLDSQKLKTEYELKQLKQIHIDVPRTNPDLPLFQNAEVQELLERVLYIWAIRHPGSGYVQGINDLVTPFIVVFFQEFTKEKNIICYKDLKNDFFKEISKEEYKERVLSVENDIFWCFSLFIDFIQDHYTFGQTGIRRMVGKLEEIIKKIDLNLYDHLKKNEVDFMQVGLKWMNCLLTRELPINLVIRMFDPYICERDNFEVLHIYVCVAFLTIWSKKLILMDFSEIMIFLRKLPTKTWSIKQIEILVSQAHLLRNIYEK